MDNYDKEFIVFPFDACGNNIPEKAQKKENGVSAKENQNIMGKCLDSCSFGFFTKAENEKKPINSP